MPNPRDHIQSVARAFDVLATFGSGRSARQSLSQIAGRAGLDRASARRYLITLEDLGFVAQVDDAYVLRPKLLHLAWTYLENTPVAAVAEAPLRHLRDALGESCSVTVLSGTNACFVAVANAEAGLSIRLTLGNELPAAATAMGRVLLGDLEPDELARVLVGTTRTAYTDRTITDADEIAAIVARARRDGWTLADQELEVGVRSIAVPVTDHRGRVVAALAVSTPTARVTREQLAGPFLEATRDTAREISALL